MGILDTIGSLAGKIDWGKLGKTALNVGGKAVNFAGKHGGDILSMAQALADDSEEETGKRLLNAGKIGLTALGNSQLEKAKKSNIAGLAAKLGIEGNFDSLEDLNVANSAFSTKKSTENSTKSTDANIAHMKKVEDIEQKKLDLAIEDAKKKGAIVKVEPPKKVETEGDKLSRAMKAYQDYIKVNPKATQAQIKAILNAVSPNSAELLFPTQQPTPKKEGFFEKANNWLNGNSGSKKIKVNSFEKV